MNVISTGKYMSHLCAHLDNGNVVVASGTNEMILCSISQNSLDLIMIKAIEVDNKMNTEADFVKTIESLTL